MFFYLAAILQCGRCIFDDVLSVTVMQTFFAPSCFGEFHDDIPLLSPKTNHCYFSRMLCIIVLLQGDAPPIQFWNIWLHVSSYDASVYFKIRSAAAVSSHIISKDKWAVPLAAVHTHVTMVHRWSVILWTMSSSFFLLTFLIPSVHKTLSEMSPAFLCSFSELLFDLCSTGFCS